MWSERQVRVNANLKTLTVEEIREQKKSMHLTAFAFAIDEVTQPPCSTKLCPKGLTAATPFEEQVKRDLRAAANGSKAADRARLDRTAAQTSCLQLVEGIVAQCNAILGRHREVEADRYLKDSVNRAMVAESLAVKEMAMAKYDLWLCGTEQAGHLLARGLRACWREMILRKERDVELCADAEEQAQMALDLCRGRGLLLESADEKDSFGEEPLLAAAANGERFASICPVCHDLIYASRHPFWIDSTK